MKTILLILLAANINAQSLISNGSFEVYSTIPYAEGQINFATGWKDFGSADYFHEYGQIGLVNIPYSFIGTIVSYEGQACAGICTHMPNYPNYREYIYYKLDTPMVSGNEYHISLYVFNNPSNIIYGGLSSDNFGIALSMAKLQQPILNNVPQLVQSGQLYGYGWKPVQFAFLADSNYRFITIGNFTDDSNLSIQFVDSASIQCVYYFIDNVVVDKVVPLGMEEHSQTGVKRKLNYNYLGQRIR